MKKMCVLIIGCFLTAVGFGCVVIPCGFASAGVAGLARIACSLIPVSLSVMVMFINVVLFAAGYYFVGKQFVMKSLVCAVLFPVFLEICQSFPAMEFLMEEKLISAMIAGVLIGVGAGMILRSDASSGGLDVIAVIIEKKFSVPVSVTNGVLDGMVLLFQGLYGSVSSVVYGLIVVLVISFVIRRVMTSGTGVVQFMIFSDHPMEIREMLLHRADTGVTLFETVSGMRNTSAYAVMSVVPFQKAYEVRKMVTQMDPEAFVTMSDVRSVTGRGYTMPAAGGMRRNAMTVDEAIVKMIDEADGNLHDIAHFMKVHAYARLIGQMEHLDEKTQQILELSAVVHDIACPLCRVKYGNTNGHLQEKEGAELVERFFAGSDVQTEMIERISWIVSHHHTYHLCDDMDYQILLEADYLVNAHESNYEKEAIYQAYEKLFVSESGKRLLSSMYRL